MHDGYNFNDDNIQVSEHICDTCGQFFTICPAVGPDVEGWENCMDMDCESWDASRNLDLDFIANNTWD